MDTFDKMLREYMDAHKCDMETIEKRARVSGRGLKNFVYVNLEFGKINRLLETGLISPENYFERLHIVLSESRQFDNGTREYQELDRDIGRVRIFNTGLVH
ncbi:MAG: hypothetical protein WBD99_07735 [Thermodesulfobacteriota bacterium]